MPREPAWSVAFRAFRICLRPLRERPAAWSPFVASLPLDHAGALDVFERHFFTTMPDRHEGNVAAVARATGMSRATLYRKLQRLDLVER